MAINIRKSIDTIRDKEGINQKEIGEATGMRANHVCVMLRENTCTLKTIDRLAKAFGYTSSEFIALGED